MLFETLVDTTQSQNWVRTQKIGQESNKREKT
jgi:hypothetical protein